MYLVCIAAASETVISKPKKVEMLGKKLVLFRGRDGKVHCLNDACAHRGAPLSMGWTAEVEGHSCVVCPYHGAPRLKLPMCFLASCHLPKSVTCWR